MGKFNEPWEIDSEDDYFTDGPHIKNANGFGIAGIWKSGRFGENAEIARRILACVNACEGISTEDLEKGAIEALVEERDEYREPSAAEIDRHLDDVLRASGSRLRNYNMTSSLDAMRSAMRKAMAASQGEQQ